MVKPRSIRRALSIVAAALSLAACTVPPHSLEAKVDLEQRARAALAEAQADDAAFATRLAAAQACAIFPGVGKGGAIVGFAYGKGVLVKDGQVVGYCDLSQGSLGAQLGGQGFVEIICFETLTALERFTDGVFSLNAQATAVAFGAGASAVPEYGEGVSLLVRDEAGLMAEAVIGAQEFRYDPIGLYGDDFRP